MTGAIFQLSFHLHEHGQMRFPSISSAVTANRLMSQPRPAVSCSRLLSSGRIFRGRFLTSSPSQQRLSASIEDQMPKNASEAGILTRQGILMCLSGAILGPLCDAQHSRYRVLRYRDPSVIHIPGLGYDLETCWWVPLLFGVAGIIIGLGQPLLDDIFSEQGQKKRICPSWFSVWICISFFVLQYWASGRLAGEIPESMLLVILGSTALAQWLVFDASSQGFLLASLTALGGPLIEIGLINWGQLYTYTSPDIFGVPFWIPCVYFCGAPAVGNLGRIVRSHLRQKEL